MTGPVYFRLAATVTSLSDRATQAGREYDAPSMPHSTGRLLTTRTRAPVRASQCLQAESRFLPPPPPGHGTAHVGSISLAEPALSLGLIFPPGLRGAGGPPLLSSLPSRPGLAASPAAPASRARKRASAIPGHLGARGVGQGPHRHGWSKGAPAASESASGASAVRLRMRGATRGVSQGHRDWLPAALLPPRLDKGRPGVLRVGRRPVQ